MNWSGHNRIDCLVLREREGFFQGGGRGLRGFVRGFA